MNVGVIDAGVAVSWILRRPRSLARIDELFRRCRSADTTLVLSVVNLSEVLRHTAAITRGTGSDAVAMLRSTGVQLHQPDEAIARRVAELDTSLADGFAAGTALALRAHFHTTDNELIARLRGTRLVISRY